MVIQEMAAMTDVTPETSPMSDVAFLVVDMMY